MKKLMLSMAVLCLCMTGCWKPYHEAMLVDIGTSEVAFLVETVNDNGQAVVAPKDKGENKKADGTLVDFYKNRMINARKVEIPYYWKQTHRRWVPWDTGSNGKWVPAARLIVVDTQPENREWTSDKTTGSTKKDQAIWVESSDSVGFSTGISLTSRIQNQDDAIKFLSNYPPATQREVVTAGGEPFVVEITSLEQVMDQEVRQKVQEVFAYESAAFTMDELREKKREIMDTVKEEIVPFFAERGISITTIGQFGGFAYENPDIQLSIDKVFQAQQDEEVAKAETKAASARKEALKLEGEGEAQKSIAVAEGEAQAIQAVADAKAYELEKLNANPQAYLTLKMIEIAKEGLEKWDGTLPRFLMGGPDMGDTSMLLNLDPQKVAQVTD
jgi:regulator of protease activity HflC (stomatin/prohibitin superfamily)